jgi:hypothetical protein
MCARLQDQLAGDPIVRANRVTGRRLGHYDFAEEYLGWLWSQPLGDPDPDRASRAAGSVRLHTTKHFQGLLVRLLGTRQVAHDDGRPVCPG